MANESMTFQTLLISSDEEARALLAPVLSGFGLGVTACSYAEALAQLEEKKFDAVIVDFEDPEQATLILQNASPYTSRTSGVSVALLGDRSKVRNVFGSGANFVLYKPIVTEQAQASLRAAIALIKRERRRSFRVPVQVPVELQVENGAAMEGILLDLSEDGMDVLAAQPLFPSTKIHCRFNLQDSSGLFDVTGAVAWANPNGQSGVRFVDLSEETRENLKNWVTSNAHELPPADSEPVSQCKLTDLSLGGCYVETDSPFPERSAIVLSLKAGSLEVRAEGVVRVAHPAFGMGVEFASRTTEQREQVGTFIDLLSSTPGTSPELQVLPRALFANDVHGEEAEQEDSDDALLNLLRHHESLSQEEFLHALHDQRGTEAVPS
jgi:CheY-like chemotaxis protein